MLYTAFEHQGPTAVRYPRGSGSNATVHKDMHCLPIGKGEIRRKGKKIAILAFGSMLAPALQAADILDATVANMRFVKPLDIDLVHELANTHDLVVTVEENSVRGGAGAAVLETLQSLSIVISTLCLGLPDNFIEHGVHETMLANCGLNAVGIVSAIEKKLT